jgi:hypothetical protein
MTAYRDKNLVPLRGFRPASHFRGVETCSNASGGVAQCHDFLSRLAIAPHLWLNCLMAGHKRHSRVMTVRELRPYLRAYPRQAFAILAER